MTQKHSPTLNLSSVTESMPMNWRRWIFFLIVALIMFSDGMDATIVSHIFPTLIEDWAVRVGGGIALVVSGGYIAMGVGAITAGRLADLFGRKTVLTSSTILFGLATLLGATSGDFTAFTVWRLIACLGMGATVSSATAYIPEIVPKKYGLALLAVAFAMLGLGTSVGAMLAGWLIPTQGWPTLLTVAGAIPITLGTIALLLLPESPANLAARGAITRAKRALRKLSPKIDLESVNLVLNQDRSTYGSLPKGSSLSGVFSKDYAPITIILFVFGAISQGTWLTVVQYLPTLLQLPSPGLDTVQSSTIMMIMGFVSTGAGLLLGVFLARWSRFLVFGFLLCFSAVLVTVLGIMPSPDYLTLLVAMTLVGAIVYISLSPPSKILAAAAYPTDIRAAGIGTSELGGRLGSAVGGAAGGIVIGAGLGFSGFFLLLLAPLVALMLLLGGLRKVSRGPQDKTKGNDKGNSSVPQPVSVRESNR